MRIEFRRNFILLLKLEIVSNRYFITDTGFFTFPPFVENSVEKWKTSL